MPTFSREAPEGIAHGIMQELEEKGDSHLFTIMISATHHCQHCMQDARSFSFAWTRSKLRLSPVQGQNLDLSSMMVANMVESDTFGCSLYTYSKTGLGSIVSPCSELWATGDLSGGLCIWVWKGHIAVASI